MLMFGFVAAGCAKPDDQSQRCAQLAEARASIQLQEELDALEQRTSGPPEDGEVERKLIELDAKAYREEVYRECLRRRGLKADEEATD